jgi:tRNA (guanine-N7-)-methyltransferase
MGHDKLRKFAENETFSCLLQPSAQELLADGYFHLRDHPVKGHWGEFFSHCVAGPAVPPGNPATFGTVRGGTASEAQRWGPKDVSRGELPDGKLVLELGCGKGEYTIALAERDLERNYIGVDIKGARLWKGAKYATEHQLPNVAFLRTRVEFITAFFAPGEVSEVWLTFSDPQYRSENSRLCSPLFLERYRSFLKPGGIVHLKTDSRFLHEYALAVCRVNGLRILAQTSDLYGSDTAAAVQSVVREVKTFYEQLFLEQGYPITYLSFVIDHEGPYVSPRDPKDFDSKAWRAAEGPRLLFGHDSAETRRQKIHSTEA